MKKKRIAPQPVTKKDLKALKQNIKIDIAVQISDLETRVDDKTKKYHDEILTKLDQIAKNIELEREDRAIAIHQDKEFQKQIDKHDKRIKKLEIRTHAA